MSRMTCLIIFSGSSARSIMSLRLARIKVLTRSKSPIVVLPSLHENSAKLKQRTATGEHGMDLHPCQAGQREGHQNCSPEYERARLLHCQTHDLPSAERSAEGRRWSCAGGMRLCLTGTGLFRLQTFVADQADFAEQLRHLHATERFEERGHLGCDFGDVTGDLVSAGCIAIACGHDGDFVHLTEGLAECADNFRQGGYEFVHDRGLVVFLKSLCFDVHRARFGLALLEDDLGFGFTLSPDRRCAAFGFADHALAFGGGDGFNALTFDFGAFENSSDKFAFAASDFGFLHLNLRFALDLHYADLFGD